MLTKMWKWLIALAAFIFLISAKPGALNGMIKM
jgi:hypothetical protein